MDINVISTVNFPRPAVFAAMRDQMPALAEFMPNITAISVESRDESVANEVRLVNRWQASQSEVPMVARKFVDSKRMFWHDHAHWTEGDWRCAWRLEMGFMSDRITCTGVTSYHETATGTEMRIKGTLTLNLKGFLPRIILRKAQPAIENFVLGTIKPNFQKTADAVAAYLETQQSAG